MKLTIRYTIFLIAMVFFVMPAKAQDFNMGFKPYVGGGLGAFELDYGNGKDFVFGGYGALGAELNDYLALEFRIGAAGSSTKNDTGTSITGNVKQQVNWFTSYLAKPQIEVADGLDIYALLGASTVRSEITPAAATGRRNTTTGFSFGGGLEYNFQDQFAIGAEWMRYSSQKDTGAIGATSGYKGLNMNGFVGTLKANF